MNYQIDGEVIPKLKNKYNRFIYQKMVTTMTSALTFAIMKSSCAKLVVLFGNTTCGPCKQLEPHLDEMSKHPSDAVFIKLNIDEFEQLGETHSIATIPTVIVFKYGTEVGRVKGVHPSEVKKLL